MLHPDKNIHPKAKDAFQKIHQAVEQSSQDRKLISKFKSSP